MAKTEWFQATVTDVMDPERRGRIKVSCSELLDADREAGETEPPELPDWIEPMFFAAGNPAKTGGQPYGFFFVPRPGDLVEIEVNDGADMETEGGMRWRCGLYPDRDAVPGFFQGQFSDEVEEELYPHIHGFISPDGNGWMIFDGRSFSGGADDEENSMVFLFTGMRGQGGNLAFSPTTMVWMGNVDGAEGPSILITDARHNRLVIEGGAAEGEGVVYLLTNTGHRIALRDDNNTIEITHKDGPIFKLTDTDIEARTPSGDRLLIRDGNDIRIEQAGGELVQVSATAGILIGSGSSEPLVLGNTFSNLLNTALGAILAHVHPTPGAVMGPPQYAALQGAINTLITGAHLSDLAKTKK